MSLRTVAAIAFLLALVYFLTIRPALALRQLKQRARAENATSLPLKEAIATAPLPMVKYRNRLFPRLYLFADRIEYHILTNKQMAYSDIESVTVTNKGLTKFMLRIQPKGAKQTILDFTIARDQVETGMALFSKHCEVLDQRLAWG